MLHNYKWNNVKPKVDDIEFPNGKKILLCPRAASSILATRPAIPLSRCQPRSRPVPSLGRFTIYQKGQWWTRGRICVPYAPLSPPPKWEEKSTEFDLVLRHFQRARRCFNENETE